MRAGLLVVGLLAVSAAACAAQEPVVPNGGFEEVNGDGLPAGWTFGCSGGCKGALRAGNQCKAEGDRAVCLSSETEYSPNVYCGLGCRVGHLVAGVRYRFSLMAKGVETESCWFGGGPGWTARCFFPSESFDWQEFHLDWTCPDGVDAFELRINVDAPTTALWVDDVKVSVAPTETAPVPDAELALKALDEIGRQEARLPGLEAQLEQARKDGVAVAYPQADLTTGRMFCQFCRDDVRNGRIPRAAEVAEEVGEILDQAEREMRRGVDVPVLKNDGPVEIRDGSLWGACTLGGRDETQPVFLTGYGHFNRVVEDLPLFSKMGINVIQIEIGPSSIVFEDGVKTDAIKQRILPALDRARDNGARVCLLISPHYFPEWAYKQWPELAQGGGGFLKVATDAPQARDIYRQQLEALIPLVKDHPALQSICLSNEPVSLNSEKDPFRRPLWRAYIERKHGTIAALNAAYGTKYASFDDVPHPKMEFSEKPAALYDGVRFNQECFAGWHAWMVDTIHSMAPNLPCHAKVMLLPADRGTVLWGTGPWEFAKLSQMNGNDCVFMQASDSSRWASEWTGQNMYYDLQRSMKRVPIFNTENHIIRDREEGHITGEHIYTTVWQGAVHGQGASTTWVWERSYDPKSDFEGSILHRPRCAAAMNRCALDLMRCAKEVAALQNEKPRVAILYSNASMVWDLNCVPMRARVYTALNFGGVPIGFITDEQIEAGLLDQCKCLIVAGAAHASRAAIEGIRTFAEGGGTVLAYGSNNLAADEYGHEVSPPPFAAVLERVRESEMPALRDALLERLQALGIGPEVLVRTPQGELPWGVEWRTTTLDGRRIVNLVNYRKGDAQVILPEGTWTDLAACSPLTNPVTLKADTPVLAVEEKTALGLVINEDNSHFFGTRAPEQMTVAGLDAFVDQYAGTKVTHLFLNPNAMRASFRSSTRDAIWDEGTQYIPKPDEPGGRWPSNCRLLWERGLDPYAVWIARAREKGIVPWLSMRMNDVHCVDEPKNFMHSSFWVSHPEYWRVPGGKGWTDRALDFGRPEVREHAMSFVRELLDRYDPDGLELDWMRFGWHFAPGKEAEGVEQLCAFTREARGLVKAASEKRGHPIKLGARVPADPDAARGLGMDGVRWVKEGLIDMLVPCPFWTTSDFDIPVEKWREQMGDAAKGIVLAPGLEYNIRAWPGGGAVANDLESVRGFAAASYYRGADQIYLFNFMDSETIPVSQSDYRTLLEQGMGRDVVTRLPRRHIATFHDTVPSGFGNGAQLPLEAAAGGTVRLNIGPAPEKGKAVFMVGLAAREGV